MKILLLELHFGVFQIYGMQYISETSCTKECTKILKSYRTPLFRFDGHLVGINMNIHLKFWQIKQHNLPHFKFEYFIAYQM